MGVVEYIQAYGTSRGPVNPSLRLDRDQDVEPRRPVSDGGGGQLGGDVIRPKVDWGKMIEENRRVLATGQMAA